MLKRFTMLVNNHFNLFLKESLYTLFNIFRYLAAYVPKTFAL